MISANRVHDGDEVVLADLATPITLPASFALIPTGFGAPINLDHYDP